MTWNIKRELVPLGILIAVAALAFLYGPGLPEQVPSHFDAEGYPDGTMPRTAFLLMISGVVVGLYVVLTFIPFIDPLWKKIQPRYNVLLLFRDLTMGFMLMMFVMNLIAVRDGRLSTMATGLGLGILFMLIGNYLPKVPRNWFFGIRSPWTMSSDEVWRRSHIVGGWCFVGAGLLIAVLSVAGVATRYLLPAILAPTVIFTAFVYPYLLFRRMQRTGRTDEPGDPEQLQ
ncbi:MAG: SdpI family protein [Ignavibacteriae bacterium]|nr:SdpI family protein [Ignavibacteriota bacterium]